MTFEQFFLRATGTAPYAYQRTFAGDSILPDLLEAPTGAGKTATAVLGWLWRRRHGTDAPGEFSGGEVNHFTRCGSGGLAKF